MSDFVIGLNPFLVEIMQEYIKCVLRQDMEKILERKKNQETKVVRKHLEAYEPDLLAELDKEYKPYYRTGDLNVIFLYEYIKFYYDKSSNKKEQYKAFVLFEHLKDINQELRNEAAHQFTSITEERIKTVSSKTSKQIVKDIEGLFVTIFKNKIKASAFDIYDTINQYINKELEEY